MVDMAATPCSHVEVTSPIPGTIVAVKVRPGDRVKEGDVIMVLEAMKMENDIVAPKSGVVAEIRVQEGQTVDSGILLAVIDSREC